MIYTIIGMSNSGKSYWSSKLAEEMGFVRYCVDDMIEEKLAPYLIDNGYKGIADVSKWMGQPYEERYGQNSDKYLQFEEETMNQILDKLAINIQSDVVIDTTGSVIYTSESILSKIKNQSKVVYLETPAEIVDEMLEKYLKEPKPVFWGKSFDKKEEETNLEALSRCYPELLKFRQARYKVIADITIDYFTLRAENFDLDQFLKTIQNEIL
jgi:shikimate kinase